MRLAPLILAALPLAAAPSVTGKWTMNGDVAGNPIPLTCSFKEAEAKLSGKCTVGGTEVDAAGTVKDQTITFTFTAGGYELTYTGKVDGDNISGDIAVAGTTGTFSGKREKE